MGLSTAELEGVPNPGDVVAGKYRVDRLLGVGGMGAVVQATHTSLGQRMAIKFLLAEMALNPNSTERFMREAQSAATILSDHVVRVHDLGTLDNGTPYMVMEFLDGEDLSDTISRGALPVDVAARYLLQAAEALAEAHKMGIIHRDLKPANLFLARRPDGTAKVKVLDFGISKIVAGAGADLTRTTALMGSPVYMAPEQMESAKNADARSDVWAMGTILYELVTGTLPFIGETLPEICTKILQADPPSLTETRPDAPPGLQAIIGKALTKKPDDRYQNLAEFACDLAPLGGDAAFRSAEAICRVLGVSPPPGFGAGATGPRAAMSSSPDLIGAMAGSMPTPTGVGVVSAAGMGSVNGQASFAQPGTNPGLGPAGAAQSIVGGHTDMGSMNQPGMAAAQTYPSMDQPGGSPAMPHQAALGVGRSTAAPVSQTMNGMRPQSAKTGLIVGIAAACLILGGGVVAVAALASGGTEETAAAAATSETTTDTSAPDETSPTDMTGADTSAVKDDGDGGTAEAAASATASATATTSPAQTGKTDTPRRPPRTWKPRRPKGQRPGDEIF